MVVVRQNPAPKRMRDLVEQAASRLAGDGWSVVDRSTSPAAPWHLTAERGTRRRVVQIATPDTSPAARQERLMLLGEAARLTPTQGTMEQWLAHVRPDGRVTFGAYILNGQRWNP